MSTRSNIIIAELDNINGVKEIVNFNQIYHHSDGYIKGVGFELLLNFLKTDSCIDDLITKSGIDILNRDKVNSFYQDNFYNKYRDNLLADKKYEEETCIKDKKILIDLHSDIEYLYFVAINKNDKDHIFYLNKSDLKKYKKDYNINMTLKDVYEFLLGNNVREISLEISDTDAEKNTNYIDVK